MNGKEYGDLIDASGLTYQQVADFIGVSKNLISLQVRGERRITEEQEAKAVPFLRRKAHERLNDINNTLAEVG